MTTINIVINSLTRGGTERHISQILPALAARGFSFRVIPLKAMGDFAKPLQNAGIPLLPPGRENPSLWQRFMHIWRFVRKHRNEPLHFFLPESYIIGMLACLCAGHRGCRIMSRRSLNDYQQRHPVAARLEHALHHHLDAASANAAPLIQDLITEGLPEQKCHLIYNGVDTTRFEAPQDMRSKLGIAPNALVMAMVANLLPYKGHADLLAALAFAATDLPDDWHLLVIGRDDGIGAQLREQAETNKIASHLHWLGSRTDIENLLASSDIALLTPTGNEGFSNAILEAMSSGLPVIATDVGGNREAVGEDAGIIVPPHDPHALKNAILTLANDAALRDKMGQTAQARIKAHFTLTHCVDAYARFYEEIL